MLERDAVEGEAKASSPWSCRAVRADATDLDPGGFLSLIVWVAKKGQLQEYVESLDDQETLDETPSTALAPREPRMPA